MVGVIFNFGENQATVNKRVVSALASNAQQDSEYMYFPKMFNYSFKASMPEKKSLTKHLGYRQVKRIYSRQVCCKKSHLNLKRALSELSENRMFEPQS